MPRPAHITLTPKAQAALRTLGPKMEGAAPSHIASEAILYLADAHDDYLKWNGVRATLRRVFKPLPGAKRMVDVWVKGEFGEATIKVGNRLSPRDRCRLLAGAEEVVDDMQDQFKVDLNLAFDPPVEEDCTGCPHYAPGIGCTDE